MKKDQLVRLRFIDAVFAEYGQFSRKMLTETFGISEITASRDLSIYKQLNSTILYDISSKFFRTEGFKEVEDLWENAVADSASYLKAIEMIYDVKIGTQPVPSFGVHKA